MLKNFKNIFKKPVLIFLKICDRVLGITIYLIPFLELYGFFNIFLRSYDLSPPIIEQAALFLRINNWLNFVIFTLIIFLTQSRRVNLSYFTRFNLLQALVLIFVSSFMDSFGYLFPLLILAKGTVGYLLFNSLSFIFILVTIYCMIYAIRGKSANIPLLTESVRLQVWLPKKEDMVDEDEKYYNDPDNDDFI